jgi:poly-gamma-glutamate capsule biosynthesis protein CapA/YwtB (metallophosphatase superfamily)
MGNSVGLFKARGSQTLFLLLLITALLGGCFVPRHHASHSYRRVSQGNPDFTPEMKHFQTVRLEGKSRMESSMVMLPYLRKYRNKRLVADHTTIRHFRECQCSAVPRDGLEPDLGITLAFVGDIMWVGRVRQGYANNSLRHLLEGADMLFGNLETPVDTTRRVPWLFPDKVSYNSNKELLTSFQRESDGGNLFTALSLANNHAFDRGAKGLLHTMALLDNLGIAHTGAAPVGSAGRNYIILEKDGYRIGLYAATFGLNGFRNSDTAQIRVNILPGIAPPDPDRIDLSEIAGVLTAMEGDSVDCRIISLHWGYEYELYPDPLIRQIARQIVALGADIIMGHHPHVIQPVEMIYVDGYQSSAHQSSDQVHCTNKITTDKGIPRKGLVIYSSGNFTSRMYTRECREGKIEMVHILRQPDTGRCDWIRMEPELVRNEPSAIPGRRHRLTLAIQHSDRAKHPLLPPWAN